MPRARHECTSQENAQRIIFPERYDGNNSNNGNNGSNGNSYNSISGNSSINGNNGRVDVVTLAVGRRDASVRRKARRERLERGGGHSDTVGGGWTT